ncbi:hypothetical protein D3C73_715320 [compost metagenome]
MLDHLEERRAGLEALLNQAPEGEDFEEKIKKLKADVSPETVELIINSAFYYIREHAETETKQSFIKIVRQFVQQLIIAPRPSAGAPRSPRPDRLHPGCDRSGNHGEAVRGLGAPRLSGEIARQRTRHGAETKKLLDAYAEERCVK